MLVRSAILITNMYRSRVDGEACYTGLAISVRNGFTSLEYIRLE